MSHSEIRPCMRSQLGAMWECWSLFLDLSLEEEMKISAGLSFMPKVYIIDADYMNESGVVGLSYKPRRGVLIFVSKYQRLFFLFFLQKNPNWITIIYIKSTCLWWKLHHLSIIYQTHSQSHPQSVAILPPLSTKTPHLHPSILHTQSIRHQKNSPSSNHFIHKSQKINTFSSTSSARIGSTY